MITIEPFNEKDMNEFFDRISTDTEAAKITLMLDVIGKGKPVEQVKATLTNLINDSLVLITKRDEVRLMADDIFSITTIKNNILTIEFFVSTGHE